MTRIVSFAKKKPRRIEEIEQVKFVKWLREKGYRCHHSPNGFKRSMSEGVRLKAMGTSRGFPDIQVFYPVGNYHGFFIEMKNIEGGRLTREQEDWLNYLKEIGYWAECAHGFEEAKEIFLKYIFHS